ncbi:MAG: efflux RND transporter permease subunit [Sedimentisphaerales bacterium]|nr:efflux RND transporter permease subunit [Sedimentisphaerales bacterium]
MNLTRICVARPVLVAMIMLALTGLGVFSYLQLPKEMFPNIEFPMVTVVTVYEGAGPDEVEQLITRELEDEISTVEGIKHLWGISQQGISLVMAEFYLETDVDVAAADVRDKVNLVRAVLPESAEDPIVQKFDFGAMPIMQLAISAPRSLREVYQVTDQRIKDRIATVPDVASVTIVGGQEREIHILTDQQRLRANGLSIRDVIGSVAAANLEMPGGRIQQNSREYNIRLRGKFADLDQIRDLPVRLASGRSIQLREIAEVRDTYKDIRDMVRTRGRTCVGMLIQKRADGNTVKIDAAVRAQIKQLEEILPDDFEITIQDESATWIVGALANVFGNMRVGVVLTAIALFVFLHSLRGTLVVALTIPISVVATFIIMYLTGFTLNLMSMMGLAMTIGILVDNSVLVLENITRFLHMDHSPRDAAVKGTIDIAIAVVATTMTNLVIFVPIAFMGGIIGQFFRDLGLTATFATICSLFISFTLTPMLAAKLLTKQNTTPGQTGWINRFGRGFDRGLERVKNGYAGSLRWCLRHRFWTLVLVGLLFAGTLMGPGRYIGGEFITEMDQGKFVVMLEMPTGTRLEETSAAVRKMENLLMDKQVLPELVSTYAVIGRWTGGGFGASQQSVNLAQIAVSLVAKELRRRSTEQVMTDLRPLLAAAGIPGAKIKLLKGGEGGGGGEAPIQMEITGENMDRILAFAAEAVAIISDPRQIDGAVDVDTNYRQGQPEIRVVPDRDKCRDAGVSVDYLAQVVLASFEGMLVNEYRLGAYNYDIRVRNDERSRRQVEDVRQLTVVNPAGALIPLPQLATVHVDTGPSQLFRKDRLSLITVSAEVSGRSLSEIVEDIRERMKPLLEKYPECKIFFGGQTEMMEDSFGRLGVAMVMAICLTYMLLGALLESFGEPVLILLSLPLSLIGVLLALFLMGGRFSIFSVMAMVILIGLVINNAIIVLNYVRILRAEGRGRTEAFVEAGTIRLRPMLMTNLTTIAALIPLSLGLGWAGEIQAPMGMVQIGGLITGGWIGLLIVPVMYTLTDDLKIRLKRSIHRSPQTPTAGDAS